MIHVHRGVAALAVVALLAGCAKTQDATSSATAAPASSASTVAPASSATTVAPASGQGLTAAEIQYGVAPTRNPAVTYQPDVIIPDGGASAVRSVSPDNLTWTIDANAPHASELAVGKIMFLTGRAVGRILAETRTGNDLALTLGPVEITDVISDADLSGQNIALDPNTMFSYSAPDYPGASVDTDKIALVRPQIRFASDDGQAAIPELALGDVADNGPPPSTDLGGYKFTAFCCGGLGVKLAHSDPKDVSVLAYAVLRVGTPHVDYDLKISGGKIVTALVKLDGTAGLTVHFEAGTAVGATGNVDKQFYVPVDLSFPIGGLAVPLALTVHQQFIIKTVFTAKNSTLKATGDFSFSGALRAGYENGSWGVTAPTNYGLDDIPVDTITGLSLGASAVEIAYEGRVIIGIGAFGFVTGPYVGLGAAYGVTRGSDMGNSLVGAPACVAAHLRTNAVAGVGYSMPQTVNKAINKILHLLNVAPIPPSGGIKAPSKEIKTFSTSRPAGCA